MKVALLGVAHMHINSYIAILKKKEIEITGIYDRDKLLGEAFAKKHHLPFFPEIEKLLETDCDTVLICAENVYHCQLVIDAARAKKHVIVEKPMALTISEGKEMVNVAKNEQVKLMVTHPVRFSEVITDVKEILSNNDLGKLLTINASNHGKNPGGWFIEPDLSGGGALIDHTVHICDLVNYLFQLTPESVYAYTGKCDNSLKVEDTGLMHIWFKEQVAMALDTSWNRPKSYPIWGDAILELVFEKGYLITDAFGRKAKIFNDYKNEVKELYFEKDMDTLMFEAFIQTINDDLAVPVTGEDGLYTILITQKAMESAKSGRVVKI